MNEPPPQPPGRPLGPGAPEHLDDPAPGTRAVVLDITAAIEIYIHLDLQFDWTHPYSSQDPHIPAGTQQREYCATVQVPGQDVNVTCGIQDSQRRLWANLTMRCPLFGTNSVTLLYVRSDAEAPADSQRSAAEEITGPNDQPLITVTSFNRHLSPLYVNVSIVGLTRRLAT